MNDASKQLDFPNLIVSVESRKGGVGKTTAALCLGRILRRMGYAVLVLDMDVTGTNAADIADSPFWSSDLHVVRQQSMEDRVKERASTNLLELFDEYFMTGKVVPSFSAESPKSGDLTVNLKHVNVFGSQIYRSLDSTEPKDSKTKGILCLERPSVLFDDLHTLWLLDFIRQIIGDFCRVVGNYDSSENRVAVIIDNSPGYVGVAPAIHEWLTDCGPIVGKFLTVTSLDAQDLQACSLAIDALHGLYQTKWETSRLFLDAGKPGSDISLSKEQQGFFMRLATVKSELYASTEPLVFFKTELQSKDSDGESFKAVPQKYIGLLVNRVPRSVKQGHLAYELSNSSINGLSSVVQTLSYGEGAARWREHMVSYDEYIENQFLLQSLQRRRRRSERRLHGLMKLLSHSEERIRLLIGNDRGSLSVVTESNHAYARLKAQLVQSNEIVISARSAMGDAGLERLSRLIHDNWLPGSIIPSFRSALSSLFRESDFPYFDMIPFDLDTGPVNPDAREFIEKLKKYILMEMHDREGNEVDPKTTNVLASVLANLVSISLTDPLWHPPFQDELVGLFAGVLSIELRHWRRHNEGTSSNLGVQRFLAQESVKHSELEKELFMSRDFRFFRHHMMRGEGESSIADFYAACTSAQARLIDFAADSRFLLQLIQFLVREEMERGELFPFIRGLAEEVIERKTVRHEDAPAKMALAMKSAEYFHEFDQVLTRILEDWGVVNG